MRDRPTSLMLFAAGFGTRMKALTKDRPKPMIEVAGKPLIEIAIEIGKGAGIETIVANTHYFPDMIRDHVTPLGVKISHEEGEIAETGGGLKLALGLLGDGPVLTMNTDAAWKGDNPITQLLEAWDPTKMDALLLLVDPKRAVGHEGGDFSIDVDGRIHRGGPFVYSGLQIIKTDLLADIKEASFSVSRLWEQFAQKQSLFGTVYSGHWCDVGHPEGIELAEEMLARDV